MTIKVQNISRAALAAVLCVASLARSPGHAQVLTDDQGVRYQKVSLAGLDPNSASDLKVIVSRVHTAAEEVCGPMPSSLEQPFEARAVKACISTAQQDALAFVQQIANKPGGAGQVLAEIKHKP